MVVMSNVNPFYCCEDLVSAKKHVLQVPSRPYIVSMHGCEGPGIHFKLLASGSGGVGRLSICRDETDMPIMYIIHFKSLQTFYITLKF